MTDRCWSLTSADLDRRDHWQQAVSTAYRSAGVKFTSAPRTHGSLRTFGLGNISLTRIEADERAGLVERHSGNGSVVTFSLLLEGEASFRFHSRRAVLRRGDGILLDADEAMDFECSSAKLLSFDVPRYVLEGTSLPLGDLNGWQPGRTSHWGQVLHESLSAVWEMSDEIEFYRSTLEAQLLSSISMLISSMEISQADKRTALALKIRRSIRELFFNKSITASKLAKYHDISVRQMHSCLAALGTTYGQELLNARLANAEKYMSDRRHAHTSIAEIAYQSGFVDASHLRRRLRERHGMSPSEFRGSFGLAETAN